MSEELPQLDYVDPLTVEHNANAVAWPTTESPQKSKNGKGDRKERRRERNEAHRAKDDHVSDVEPIDPLVEGLVGDPGPVGPSGFAGLKLAPSEAPQEPAMTQEDGINGTVESTISAAPSSGATGVSPLILWALDVYESVSPAIPGIVKAVKTSPIGMSKTLVVAGGLILGVGILLTIGENKKRRGE